MRQPGWSVGERFGEKESNQTTKDFVGNREVFSMCFFVLIFILAYQNLLFGIVECICCVILGSTCNVSSTLKICQ